MYPTRYPLKGNVCGVSTLTFLVHRYFCFFPHSRADSAGIRPVFSWIESQEPVSARSTERELPAALYTLTTWPMPAFGEAHDRFLRPQTSQIKNV
jgi:hypothetical protein